MLDVNNLSCGYNGVDVVKNINFTLNPNERLCIIGPNGCGKSTLLKALSGLLDYRGSAKLDGFEISKLKRRELSQKVALFSQFSSVYFSYSVYDTVAMGRYLKSKSIFGNTKDDESAVMSCLEKLSILDIKDKPITELSGGQLQRVLLARVLAQDPDIILLDEPTNHLDIAHQRALLSIIDDFSKQENKAVIGVIHDLSLTPMLFERAILMDNGELILDGDIRSVLKSNEISRAYNTDITSHMRESLKFWE